MSASTSATKILAPVASDEYIMVPSSSITVTETVESKTLSHQRSTSSDGQSWDFASVKNSRERIPGSERAATTPTPTIEGNGIKNGGPGTKIPFPKGGRGLANPPPRRGLRTVPAYQNLRATIPHETKHVAGLPVIWAKTGNPKHDLQLFDRVYLGKEDPNKTSF
ncbi:hypothetical protein TWF481_002283 [Arthrobotrys musiformis]|uniref:Uncharacterized protein n=1 Tax=Arthrobotrys musiformis TaxID=47236 RepID=A0AAV9VTT7_9PEZI